MTATTIAIVLITFVAFVFGCIAGKSDMENKIKAVEQENEELKRKNKLLNQLHIPL